MNLKIEKLPEPELVFKEGTATFCKVGLLNGSYSSLKGNHVSKIKIGIIGRKEIIGKAKEWLELCNNFIESKAHDVEDRIDKNLFPDFPGSDTAFETRFITEDSYIQPIILSDIARLDVHNEYKYFNELLPIFEEKIRLIIENNDNKPDVILCVLSEDMFDTCHIVGDYHRKLIRKKKEISNQLDLFKDFDTFKEDYYHGESVPFSRKFKSALKKIIMHPDIRIPIQIIKEDTLNPESVATQNAATKGWNFCTGIFYKAGNIPWILKDFDTETLFLGISFYHKKDYYNDNIFTSMAHLFSNDFDSLILKGEKVNYDEILKRPYLDYTKAQKLIEKVLDEYTRLRKVFPKRIVIHKTSLFSDDETSSFSKVLEANGISYDLITLTKSSLRLIRYGKYPIPRGTYVPFNDSHFLYTKGYIPELKTYPGVHIPAPFQIQKKRGDSSMKDICREILALTKLNWNTADFCSGLPITIGFSQTVGEILKEFDDKDKYEPVKSYRFYM